MKPLSILVDLDSTLVEILPKWLERTRTARTIRSGGEAQPLYTPADVTSWDSPHLDLEVLGFPEFFEDLPPMPGGREAMKRLHDDGHKIIVCSAPATPESAMYKLRWVKEHLPFLNWKHTILTQKKERIPTDVLIDDSPSLHKSYRKAHGASFIATVRFPCHTLETFKLCNVVADGWDRPIHAWNEIYERIRGHAAGAVNDRCTHPRKRRGGEYEFDTCIDCGSQVAP